MKMSFPKWSAAISTHLPARMNSAAPEFGSGGHGAGRRTRKPKDRVDPANPATWGKVGRNEPCPCGSGKKYKHCHGAYV